MGRWHDGEGGLAHCEGIRQAHRRGEVGAARSATLPVLGSAMLREASWSRSNSSWGMSQFKRPNATLGANSGFDQRSMIALASSRILELGARCGRVADNSLGRPLGLPCRSSVGCLDCVVVHLLLRHGCSRSVGPLCNFDCEHQNRRQPFRLGRFLRR